MSSTSQKNSTSFNYSASRPTSIGKREPFHLKQKSSITSKKEMLGTATEELLLTPARDDVRTTGFSKNKIIESAQRHHSPRALMLINAT